MLSANVHLPGADDSDGVLRMIGDLIGSQIIDRKDGSLVGTSVAFDAEGASLVGTRYRTAYLATGAGGRLWRLGTPGRAR
jgi:hypothetical protein